MWSICPLSLSFSSLVYQPSCSRSPHEVRRAKSEWNGSRVVRYFFLFFWQKCGFDRDDTSYIKFLFFFFFLFFFYPLITFSISPCMNSKGVASPGALPVCTRTVTKCRRSTARTLTKLRRQFVDSTITLHPLPHIPQVFPPRHQQPPTFPIIVSSPLFPTSRLSPHQE